MHARPLRGISALALLTAALLPTLMTACSGSSKTGEPFGDGQGGEGNELRDAPGTMGTGGKTGVGGDTTEKDTGTGGETSAPTIDCGDQNACTVEYFDGETCTSSPVADGSPCDDGNLCTQGDTCQAGLCTPGTKRSTSFEELSRLSTYGTGYGLAAGTGDGQFVFVDPIDRGNALTVARLDQGGSTVEGDYWQTESDPYFGVVEEGALAIGWPGHVIASTSRYWGEMMLITVADDGAPSLHGELKLPESDPPFVSSSQLNGLAGQGDDLWACGNLSHFFSAPKGTVYHYDVSDPDEPALVESYPMPGNTTCGSIAIAEDGSQIFVNTMGGIRWFEPNSPLDGAGGAAGASGSEEVVWHDAFGENSGITIMGDRLLSRTNDALTIYSRVDQNQLNQRTIENLRGVAYLPDHDVIAVLHFPPVEDATTYARKLLLLDAAPDANLALLDEAVIARDVPISSRTIAVSGSTIVDQATKTTYAVTAGNLAPYNSPQVGEITALSRRQSRLLAWGNHSRLVAATTDLNSPSWLSGHQTGGPDGVSLVQDRADRTLVATPDDYPDVENDRLVISYDTPKRNGGVQVLHRDIETGAIIGLNTLANTDDGVLQWAGDSLYHLDYASDDGAVLSHWNSATLAQSNPAITPASRASLLPAFRATESITSPEATFVVSPDETWAFVAISQVFSPEDGSSEEGGFDLTAAWIDLTQDPPTVMASVDLRSDETNVKSCAATRTRAVCTGVNTQFYEREEGKSEVEVTLSDDDVFRETPFALNQGWVYIAADDGLRRVPFGFSQADYDAAPLIPLANKPTTMASLPGGMAVASRNELVFVTPECMEHPVLIDPGAEGAGGAGP